MTGPDMHARLIESMERRAAEPEGVQVRVQAVLIVTEAIAREVAPLLARTLYPDREFGRVLWVEHDGHGAWDVVVEDRGPIRFTNQTGRKAPR